MGTTNHHEVVEADIVQTTILHETVSLSNRAGFPLELSDMIELSLTSDLVAEHVVLFFHKGFLDILIYC